MQIEQFFAFNEIGQKKHDDDDCIFFWKKSLFLDWIWLRYDKSWYDITTPH